MQEKLSMDKVFIKKLIDIIEINLENENFGVIELAKEAGISRSQLHRKLLDVEGKSTSQFIREYRLEKAMEMLKQNSGTASEIAYRVGFSSPTYFNTSFHNFYGYPPGEVKFQSAIAPPKKTYSKKLVGIIPVIILIGLIVFNEAFNKDPQSATNLVITIAVLPFENINNDQNDDFFVDGMAIDIHTYLSKIKGLSVISDKTIKKYRGSNKANSKIAKELGVNFLIKGNVRKYNDEIKITAQLIDANDVQVWAEPYTEKFTDILKLQQDISKKIVEQLRVELTPKEQEIIGKFPTQNMEAYNLFLEGRSFVLKRGKRNLDKALPLFQKAIALDASYAEAYAEIGNCYFLLSTFVEAGFSIYDLLDYDEALVKTNQYLEKALKINPNTFRVYATKALIANRNGLKDKAKEFYEKAIDINPNDADVNLGYGFLFSLQATEKNNRIKYIKIAQQLEPFSLRINRILQTNLLQAGKIQEAENHLSKMGFLFSKSRQLDLESKIKVYKYKDWTEYLKAVENEINKDSANVAFNRRIGVYYDEVLNDNVNYLKYYKRAYELDSTSVENTQQYWNALCENKMFKEANAFMQSDNFKIVLNEKERIQMLFLYYLHQEKFTKAQEITNDSLFKNNYLNYFKGLVYAYLEERESFNQMIKENAFDNSQMAQFYAILNEKDSMYYYLDKLTGIYAMRRLNASSEFDPYRREERFKILLKKSYLPITHWN